MKVEEIYSIIIKKITEKISEIIGPASRTLFKMSAEKIIENYGNMIELKYNGEIKILFKKEMSEEEKIGILNAVLKTMNFSYKKIIGLSADRIFNNVIEEVKKETKTRIRIITF